MRKLLFLVLTSITFAAHAGNFSLGVGGGQENIDTKTVRGHVIADLYQVVGTYRTDSGIMLGTSVMLGYPNKTWAPDEGRYELMAGYSIKVDRFSPYAIISYGKRTRDNVATIDYYTATIGSKLRLTNEWYADVSYRFRDSNDMIWKTDTYFMGLGYNVTPTVSVQTQYGKTTGTYDSNQFGIFVINKF